MQPCSESALAIEVVRLWTWSQAIRPHGNALWLNFHLSSRLFLRSEHSVGLICGGTARLRAAARHMSEELHVLDPK